jgi:hypothetical protein
LSQSCSRAALNTGSVSVGGSDGTALWKDDKAARYLNLTTNWLAKLRMSGGGPKFVKMSRRVFYRRCDLDDWIAKRLTSSTSQKTEAERSQAA